MLASSSLLALIFVCTVSFAIVGEAASVRSKSIRKAVNKSHRIANSSMDRENARQATSARMKSVHEGVNKSHQSANLSLDWASEGQSCYGYTGGSCKIRSCSVYRNAVCRIGACTCDGCSGPDGICYPERNSLIAEGFTLFNVKFPNFRMKVQAASVFNQMKVTDSWTMGNQDKFSLYQLPGQYNEKATFFLGSDMWKRNVAAFSKTAFTAVHPWALYAKDLDEGEPPNGLVVTVCSRSDGSIMIGGVGKLPVWAYVKQGTWLVYGYSLGDPKEGGYWTPKPAFPANSLPAC